ncbi:MAG TPA: OsmC family protein [Armatimonadota bacterium]|nr:OsmC family protein [Armatimonadota bacterium]HOM72002.1 OsmC family protein [Armatimonadota bacterium]HOP79540.1 OsmC family protein [Armatimonadota bacterium]
MPTRKANAEWRGNLREGNGKISFSGFEGPYSVASRFEEGPGTNPEELIAAAHAGCFSMALAAVLAGAGYNPKRISTTAKVTVEKTGDEFTITKSHLQTEAEVDGIDEDTFKVHATSAKEGCPVSKALAGVDITMDVKLI